MPSYCLSMTSSQVRALSEYKLLTFFLIIEKAGRALRLITGQARENKQRKTAKQYQIEKLTDYRTRVNQEIVEMKAQNSGMQE